ncbi:hypothetical protein F7725_020344 [Dissostichus mawsoni]|uniref:Myb/SANT-like DNA-binding domain-containing protein n=1 Tax=Dissostichus mawsoni TaxID=36200 RepID=A0A7J5YCY3_DISMA|nr:hypothetical protein F7725_020344 [Dissostichus mawsoni]
MSAVWREEDEEFKVKVLLEAVKRNRFILLSEWKGKFNQGVSAEAKKQTWTEITNQINGLGENHREVRQIMKKWADLKCDGKRRALALRSPNGNNMRKKNLGPIERMVSHSLPGGGASFDLSPLSSPEKDLDGNPFHMSSDLDMGDAGEYALDFEENDDSMFFLPQPPPSASLTSLDPLPDNALLRMKPVHTYSRNSQSNTNSQNLPTSTLFLRGLHLLSYPFGVWFRNRLLRCCAPPVAAPHKFHHYLLPPCSFLLICLPPPPSSSSTTKVSKPAPSIAPPPASSVAYIAPSSSILPPSTPPLIMASQGLEQQRASRMILSSVSQSLEVLAQSVQLLVESQQEFVQDSLQLQRETVDILRDFSNTALTMLRDKTTNHPPAARF